jgi:hypothetical protein
VFSFLLRFSYLEAWGPPAPGWVGLSCLRLHQVALHLPYLRKFRQRTVLSLGSLVLREESLLEPDVGVVVVDARTLSGLQNW